MTANQHAWIRPHAATWLISLPLGLTLAWLNLSEARTCAVPGHVPQTERRLGWPYPYRVIRDPALGTPQIIGTQPGIRWPNILKDLGVTTIWMIGIALVCEALLRAYQFPFGVQLRGLTGLMILSSLVFGLLRVVQIRQLNELRTIERLEQLGLGVSQEQAQPRWLWAILPHGTANNYRHARAVSSLSRNRFSSSDELTVLDAAELALIVDLTHLERLELPYFDFNAGPFVTPRLDDQALARLADLASLEELDVSGQPLTDEAITHLARFPSLCRVDLTGTQISAQAISRLRQLRPELQVLAP